MFINLKFQFQKLLGQNQRIIIEYSISNLLNSMENTQEKSSYLHLASTNCSIDIDQSDKQDKIQTKSKGKKRIGPYSFYLKHLIGSGFGGKVYKGIKDNNKNVWYAIKIIKLKGMNVANIYLLNNEIAIMQEMDHQNIVKFVDVYYTQNHCYLITQFCEGGNLEKYIKHKQNVEWGSIVYQISQGCQYLVRKSIVHRDLKPANIFLKNGIWKIGDFGFAKKISHSGALIIESMKVGSPLFMPLQTLERNMYSIKSDSFALGIIIYYLIARGFPHTGKDIPSLMQGLKQKQLDLKKLDFLKSQILDVIKGLCKNNFRDRSQISQVDFSVFLSHKSIEEMQSGLLFFRGKTTEQVVLCQFINYLMKNSVHFLEDDHILYSLMSSNLYHLTSIFKWEQSKCLNQLRREYILPSSDIKITDQLYKNILKALETTILNFKHRQESLYQVATEKLLQYYRVCKCILQANTEHLNEILKSITLHQNFCHLKANKAFIQELLPIIQA